MRIVLLAIGAAGLLQGQSFETATMKRIQPGVIHNQLGPGTVVLRGDPLRLTLAAAFEVKADRIAGPSWLDTEFYEIVAKMPEGSRQEQIPAMLRVLLAERLKLAAHRENREQAVYGLVEDRGGPKLQTPSGNFRRGAMQPGQVQFGSGAKQRIKGQMTMATLARLLSGHLDLPVLDFTALPGTYEINLSWTPDPAVERRGGAMSFAAASGETAVEPVAPTGPGLFTAIRETLGLRLDARKAPVEMVVIDHVERVPVEN